MPLTLASRETAALAIAGLGTYISLHTADPGLTGANEAIGGTPTYARQPTTWTGGASDGIVNGSQVSIDVPPGTYTHFGVWSAASGGTFIGYAPITTTTVTVQSLLKVTPVYTQY